MRVYILLLSFFFITLCTSARAQEVYMNCKFFNGFYRQVGGGREDVNKDTDLSIILNKNKKTVKTGISLQYEKYTEDKPASEISWFEGKVSYTLNLINGNLSVFGETMKNILKSYNYQCEKVQKKF